MKLVRESLKDIFVPRDISNVKTNILRRSKKFHDELDKKYLDFFNSGDDIREVKTRNPDNFFGISTGARLMILDDVNEDTGEVYSLLIKREDYDALKNMKNKPKILTYGNALLFTPYGLDEIINAI